MSTYQVTASKTGLLLECQRPFDPEVERVPDEPTEPMRYGSAQHEVLELGDKADVEAIAKKWGRDIDAGALKKHSKEILAELQRWLSGKNIFDEKFQVVSRETHRATRLRHVKGLRMLSANTRVCNFDVETHTYDLREGEFGGTDDLVAESRGANGSGMRVVIDYKTGDWGTFHTPHKLPQMLTLAIQTEADAVAILHSPREGIPVMYCDPVSPQELDAHASKIRAALRRIGDGSLRPGAHCAQCPARIGCPAGDADLLKKANAIIKVVATSEEMARPLDKGAFHIFLQTLDKLSHRAREVLRADVKNGEIIARPDGLVLVVRNTEFETLSKSSITEALGKQKGEALIESLRKKGCVKKGSREELRAVKE